MLILYTSSIPGLEVVAGWTRHTGYLGNLHKVDMINMNVWWLLGQYGSAWALELLRIFKLVLN